MSRTLRATSICSQEAAAKCRSPKTPGAFLPRAALLDAIDRHIGKRGQVSGVNAGLHILLWFPEIPFRGIGDFRTRAERAGVGVYSVAPFYLTPPRHAGLLLGYASLTEKDIAEGIRRLASVLNSNRSE